MKKIIIISSLLCAMVLGGIIALSSNLIGSADDSDIITMAEAEKLALSEVNGKVVEIEKEKQGTKIYYEIEVETKDAEYELKIDAITGEIVKKSKGQLVANGIVQNDDLNEQNETKVQSHRDDNDHVRKEINRNNTNNQKENVNNTANIQKEVANNSTNVQQNNKVNDDTQKQARPVTQTETKTTASSPAKNTISAAEAKKIGLNIVSGKVLDVEVEKEKKGSKLYYEVEIDTTYAEYELLIDATTGSIVEKEIDLNDDDDDDDDDDNDD